MKKLSKGVVAYRLRNLLQMLGPLISLERLTIQTSNYADWR